MACATLKRHLEFEPSSATSASTAASGTPATKRMRCTGSPQSLRSMSMSPPLLLPSSSSSSSAVSSQLQSHQLQQQFLQQQQHQYYLYHQQQQQQQQQSPFALSSNHPSAITRLTQDKLAVRIIDELLKKRLITWNNQNEQQFVQLQQQQQQSGQQILENPCLGFENSVVVNTSDLTFNSEKPIFTFCQVNKICRKILQDYEKELCDEYEKILARKLSEQYETFVRFSQDQIRKHYHTIQPSYLS